MKTSSTKKTKDQLIAELEQLYKRVAVLETAGAKRKQVQSELVESEPKWRSLAENAANFITIVNRDHVIEYINHPVPGLELGDVIGHSAYEFIQPEYHDVARKMIESVFATSQPCDYESVATGPDGTLAYYDNRLGPIVVEGNIISVSVFATDITERKRVEEKYKVLFDSIPDDAFVLDREWRYIAMNRVSWERTSYTNDDLIWKRITEVYPQITETPFWPSYIDAMEKRIASISESEFVFETGETGWYELRLYPIHEGILVISRDITERRKAEEALRESEEKYRVMVETAQEGIWTIDKGSISSFVNQRMADMLGYTIDEMIGKHLYSFVDEHGKLLTQENIERRQQGIEEQHDFEFIHKDGKRVYTSMETGPITDSEGNYNGAMVFVQDITERRQAQDALHASETSLRLFLDNFPGVAFISDPGKCALYANKALADVYGLTIEQIQRLDFKEYVKPSLYSRIVEQDHIVVSENRILKIEETIPLESGLSEWLTYKFPIEHEDGHTLIGGFGIDITERKQTEEALRESEAKFNTAFQLLPISSVITTIPDGRIVNANNTYLANLGLSPEEVLGKTSQEILVIENPEDIDEIGQMLEKSGGVANKEITLVDKDGRRHIGLYSAEMITVQGKPHLLAITNDITERKRMEDALEANRNYLQAIVDNSYDLMTVYDMESNAVVWANRKWHELMGYIPGDLEDPLAVLHPDDVPRVTEALQSLYENRVENVRNLEYRYRTKEGAYLCFRSSITAFISNERRLMFTGAMDITERKQAEEALRESEAKFNTAFQLLPISSAITTIPDGRIVNANNTYLANLGLSPEEVLGKTSQEILVIENPEDIDEIGQMLEKSGRVANKEITIVDKDGRRYIGLYSAEMITVEGKPHLLAVTNDITERRQAQDALNERFKELRCLYGITEIVAREGITIDDIYQEALELLLTSWQYPEITCAKIAIGDKEFHTENFRDSEWNQSADITVHGITVGKLEVAYLEAMQDRRENPFLDEERLLIDAVAERLGRIIEHKQAEEQLRQTMEGLEHSNKELEQFAYIVSHDLQEPLRMVASYVQLLEKRYKDQLDQDANDFINFAVDGTIRMQQMILDILEYSRVGTKGREFESVDLNSVLSKVVTNLGGQIEDSGALITHDELPELFAEETQMLQLLQNLIGNAIKFRSEETPRIHVSGAEDNGSWVISVKDNGIGILHEYHDKIFAVFRKLHAVGKYPGSGIGLAIVAKIVERHGGKIWVDSEPGKGSTFYFAIPKKRSAA